ncbi:MAG: hypothetical protein RSC78_06200 [Acidaminococcaceae bacterium]
MNLYLRILGYIKPYLTRLVIAAFCTAMAAAGIDPGSTNEIRMNVAE